MVEIRGTRRIGVGLAALIVVATLWAAASASGAELSWSGPISLGTSTTQNIGYTQTGLDCPAGTPTCVAVDDQGQVIVFNADLSGSSTVWTLAPGRALEEVSCPAPTLCVTLDDYRHALVFDPTKPGTGPRHEFDFIAGFPPHIESEPDGLSCPTTTFCMTMAAHDFIWFDPSAGTITKVNRVPPTIAVTDLAIDCVSATVCGIANTELGQVAGRVGEGYEATHPLLPPYSQSYLGIDCPTTTLCVAVGIGLVSTFDPHNPRPTQDGFNVDASLASVSCVSATLCVATSLEGIPLRFNPAQKIAAELAHEPDGYALPGVVCRSTTSCTAINAEGGALTIPTSWSPSLARVPINNAIPGTAGVACQAAGWCASGGWLDNSSPLGTQYPAHEGVLAGFVPGGGQASVKRYVQAVSPQSNGLRLAPAAVACTPRSTCLGLGDGTSAFWETYGFDPADGSGSQLGLHGQRLPAGACLASNVCVLVGPDGSVKMVDLSGNVLHSGKIADATASLRVACASGSLCTAVDAAGKVINFDPSNPPASPPAPFGTLPSGKGGAIACPSADICLVAQGAAGAVSFDPTAASLQVIATWSDEARSIQAVACVAPDSCLAGDTAGRVLSGNPSSASGVKVQALPGANSITGVGCVSASRCAAVDRVGQVYSGLAVPIASAPPTIAGTARSGQTLTLTRGTWANAPTSYAEQWLACDATGNGCAPIAGQTGTTLVLTDAQVGHTIRVRETASNGLGSGAPATSAATGIVAPLPGPGPGPGGDPGPGGGPGPGGDPGPGGSDGRARISRVRRSRRSILVTLRCPGARTNPCTVRFRLTARGRRIGARTVKLTDPTARRLRIKLSKRGRRLLAERHRLKVILVATQIVGGKASRVGRARVTLID